MSENLLYSPAEFAQGIVDNARRKNLIHAGQFLSLISWDPEFAVDLLDLLSDVVGFTPNTIEDAMGMFNFQWDGQEEEMAKHLDTNLGHLVLDNYQP